MLVGRWGMGYNAPPMTTNHFNGRFLAIPVWAAEVIKTRGQARDLQVLVGLVGCMDLKTRTATASYTQVAECSGVSRETVKRAIKWLEAEGIISIARSATLINVYTIHYTEPTRVTGDPTWGHGRPYLGSAVTLVDEGGGVTGDPSKTDVSPAQDEEFGFTEIYTYREIEEIHREAPCGRTETDMILGEDPHEVKKEPARKNTKTSGQGALDFANAFMYHPKSLMAQNYTPRDRMILLATFKKLKTNGMTRSTIMKMINAFWSHPNFPAYSSPVEAFSSSSVQKALIERMDIKISDSDPILDMMANDFVRTSEDLPWPAPADKDLGSAVLMHCMDACYRYPETVADLARLWNGDFKDRDFVLALDALNSLVRWHCHQESIDEQSVRSILNCVSLPDPLGNDEPTMLRPPADTIGEAVYNYRRFGGG